MKNNGKTEANRKSKDESIWNFEIEWPDIDIKWDLTAIEWPEINLNWNIDINNDLWETEKISEENVKE